MAPTVSIGHPQAGAGEQRRRAATAVVDVHLDDRLAEAEGTRPGGIHGRQFDLQPHPGGIGLDPADRHQVVPGDVRIGG